MNIARLELPAHDCVTEIGIAGIPGVNEQARRIDFEIFAADAERLAVLADAFCQSFSADTNVGSG
jgi:hypothetical protein